MNQSELRDFVLNNPKLVTMRESTRYPGLFVLKYAKAVFYKGLWNDYLEECRGTVIDRDFNLVVHPFQKIYNHGVEERSPVFKPNDVVLAYDKVNGFMASVTTYRGELLVSTTGSLDSDFAIMAEQMILETADLEMVKLMCRNGTRTFMFECCHENDPHPIQETPGLYLLGYRNNSWDSTMCHMASLDTANELTHIANRMKVFVVPEMISTTISEIEERTKNMNREGYVFYHTDGRAAKIKSQYYLVTKACARKKDILTLNKSVIEEEYYPLVDHLTMISERFNTFTEQEKLSYIRSFLTSTI
jgi:hypothetical protein